MNVTHNDCSVGFGQIRLTPEERKWLSETCPYFRPEYLTYLSQYRFKPEQVRITFHPKDPSAPVSRYQPPPHPEGVPGRNELGKIQIEATGPWHETILWEVPLMATLSELFFTTVDTDWSYDGQEGAFPFVRDNADAYRRPTENAYAKARTYLENGCVFSEFGTRRRRSYHIQDLVMRTLIRAHNDYLKDEAPKKPEFERGKLMGTSNVHFAQKHSVAPIGTIAQ